MACEGSERLSGCKFSLALPPQNWESWVDVLCVPYEKQKLKGLETLG